MEGITQSNLDTLLYISMEIEMGITGGKHGKLKHYQKSKCSCGCYSKVKY